MNKITRSLLNRIVGDLFFVKLMGYKVITKGLENMPMTGKAILASNHSSYLDSVMLFYVTPRPFYAIAADFLFKIWWLGWGLRLTDCIGARDSVAGALAKLNEGNMILIFPEGECKKCREVEVGRAHKGVAVFALKTGAPVIPIGIKGTFEAWPTSRILPRRSQRIEISVGRPFYLERYEKEGKVPDEILMRNLDKVTRAIKDMLK
ncbi:MAG: lysophospholipid acyltransferase family protein [Candidatus Omnitrophica bacterium]|nr:lysophospholipid acyltransferase family protein [Candidatus Omnitrophota bacterium]